jgi:hypothetical protein
VTPPAAHGSGNALTLKTNMVLRSATFHSPPSPSSDSDCDDLAFIPPSLPRRSQTNLDDVVDAHRRRVALTLGNIDKTLAAATETSPSTSKSFRDTSLSVPRGILDHTIMAKVQESDRVLRRSSRRPTRYHESDSGLGTSIETNSHKRTGSQQTKEDTVKASAITRSAAAPSSEKLQGLSQRATNRILEHTLKPLLAKPSLKDFHPVVLACPKKIQRKEIVCLRDLEKTLLLIAPVSELATDKGVWGDTYRALCLKERTKAPGLYLEFCLTSIRCIQATVQYLTDREQTRPSDLPYSSGYFIDLVDQIRQYAQQLADAKEKTLDDKMDLDRYFQSHLVGFDVANSLSSSDEIKLHGGITINGRPAELVRVKKDGKAISIATGEPVELDEDYHGPVQVKRSASEEAEDEEEIMRSMARRKKNAPPEEYAPKKCGVPGCNKEFKRPCDLTKHEKTHSRPWKCSIPSCKYNSYGWPTEKERDRHVNDKHSSNPTMFGCQFTGCQYKSKRESNCKQHMEKAHGWTYVRTKNNGKNRTSVAGSTTLPTPPTHNMPTPVSDPSIGVATPPQEGFPTFYSGIEFPIQDLSPLELPQEIQLDPFDYSPIDNATPSTDTSGLDHSSAYQDMSTDMTMYEDIYSANAQLHTPMHHLYAAKTMAPVQNLFAFSAPEQAPAQPAPHFSPTGQGNTMLFTPTSLPDLDEGFVDDFGTGAGVDFILFPPEAPKQHLFDELPPSLAAGYSQPNSQNIPLMDWQHEYHSGFSQH